MIIRRFHAENILKYRELVLDELPDQALIGISGANESGKTAIVEAICLALFGRTFSYQADAIHRTMKWGSPKASVDLSFVTGADADRQEHRVTRYLNMEGQHSARLTRAGEGQEPAIIAQGAHAVTRAVEEICGFNFEQYVESFYLAQREIEMPQASSGMVRGLLGIAELDRVSNALQEEINDDRTRMDMLEQDIERDEQALTDLAINTEALPILENSLSQRQTEAADQEGSNQRRADTLARMREVVAEVEAQVGGLLETGMDTRFQHWQDKSSHLATCLEQLNSICGEVEQASCPAADFSSWSADLAVKVATFEAIRQDALAYIEEQGQWLGDAAADADDKPEAAIEEEGQAIGSQSESKDAPPAAVDNGATYPAQKSALDRELANLPGTRRKARWFAFFTMIIAAAFLAAYWLVSTDPDHEISKELVAQQTELLPLIGQEEMVEKDRTRLWRWIGGGFFLFGLLSIVRGSSVSRRIRVLRYRRDKLETQAEQAREHIALVEDCDQKPLPEQVEILRELGQENITVALDEFTESTGQPWLDAEALGDWMAPLADARDIFTEDAETMLDELGSGIGHGEEDLKLCNQAVADAEDALDQEQTRLEQAAKLVSQIDLSRERMVEPRARIKVRKMGLEQIKGTCRRIYNDFNVQMRDYLVKLVPLFTEGRYRHLKIDDEFKVQVFSNDKNDFVELQELSSGTHRQLVLGVRLALSQAMVDARTKGPQSMILDEPFAFFDRERIRQTLKTLPTVSREISQIWVISQEFEGSPFQVHIRCDRDNDSLVLKGSAG